MLLPLYGLSFAQLISLSSAAPTNTSTLPPPLHSSPPAHNTTSPLPSLPIPPDFPHTPCRRSKLATAPQVSPRGGPAPRRSCLLTHVSFHDHDLQIDITDEFPLLASPPSSADFPLLPSSPTPLFASDPVPTYRYVIALVSSLPVVSVKVFSYHPIPIWQRVAYPALAMFNAQRLSDWDVETDFGMTAPSKGFWVFVPRKSTPRAYVQVEFETERASGELAVWRESAGRGGDGKGWTLVAGIGQGLRRAE